MLDYLSFSRSEHCQSPGHLTVDGFAIDESRKGWPSYWAVTRLRIVVVKSRKGHLTADGLVDCLF